MRKTLATIVLSLAVVLAVMPAAQAATATTPTCSTLAEGKPTGVYPCTMPAGLEACQPYIDELGRTLVITRARFVATVQWWSAQVDVLTAQHAADAAKIRHQRHVIKRLRAKIRRLS